MKATDVEFPSDGHLCRGWHAAARDDRFAGTRGRPVVVMAHGLGGTADTGLAAFADEFCAVGVDVVAFDYRGFGLSGGGPRQSVSMQRQIEDVNSAIDAARTRPGVDPRRVVLWGVSLGGGHVMSVAAQRADVAAAIALTPLVDGWAAARLALRHRAMRSVARNTVAGVRSLVAKQRSADPVMMSVVAEPGTDAAINLDGAHRRYTSLAGPSWRNELDASIGFELLRYRPIRRIANVRCPLLVQIGDADRSAPPGAAALAAERTSAVVRRYDADHFDVWPGGVCFDHVVADQVNFLRRVFGDVPG